MTAAELPRRIALVLGGGGLKGFAHIGVLRALGERGIIPSLLAGTSIGSLIAAAHAGGMSLDEMSDRARALKRRDLFRLDRSGMLLHRLHTRAIYSEEPLRELCVTTAPPGTFEALTVPVLVNTVDLKQGTQVVWGLRGLRDVSVADAVYASCALPGFFPPGDVGGRVCVDGGVIDNLPVNIAALDMQAVIAVDTGSSSVVTQRDIESQGFASIYMRAASTMMHALQLSPLIQWEGPPMILIRPKVTHIGWFGFSHTDELIEAGYTAAHEALEHFDEYLKSDRGVFPRHDVQIAVVREKCIGCGLCVALAPEIMALRPDGIAYPKRPVVDWSPADGDFVHQCPTCAIQAERIGRPSSESEVAIEGERKPAERMEPPGE